MKKEQELFVSVMIVVSCAIVALCAWYWSPICFHRFNPSPLCLVAPNQADTTGNGIVSLPVLVCSKCGVVQVSAEIRSFHGFKVDNPINVIPTSPIPESPKPIEKVIEDKKIDTKYKKK